ncbi:UDP-N-acetylmuramate dehydrogenase [Halomonas halocynthiae]|uniref:UDP-N-acetylmuramate dehydrogenase n=1 Tax=Halomonas halocynthiae TaxID=176290 RepID=UPI0003FFAA0B|nr:UDP-N-acetylmuramate dehydrogenase [Halomonas halocynthiae]
MRIFSEHDLSQLNTLGLPCVAEQFAEADSSDSLLAVLSEARNNAVTVLGGGSNLILPPYLHGMVVQPTMAERHFEPLANGGVRVRVGAGVNWHELVIAAASRGLWGIENLALIPGHCGAAPIQNIGAYGVELSDVLECVELVDIRTGKRVSIDADECEFGYRDSVFKRRLDSCVVITSITLRLSRRPQPRLGYGDLVERVGGSPSALDVAEAVGAVRREKLPDPRQLANAGSFFKNPLVSARQVQMLLSSYPDMPHYLQSDGRSKLAAGWMIDQCGLKGWREGHFGVHDRQALVLVHHGGGSAQELLDFSATVANEVNRRFGVTLEREPRLAGGGEAEWVN